MDQQAAIVNKFTVWLHIYAPVFFAMLCPSQVAHITEAHWNKAYVPECCCLVSSFIVTTVSYYVPSREYLGLLIYSVLMTRICESIAQHII